MSRSSINATENSDGSMDYSRFFVIEIRSQ